MGAIRNKNIEDGIEILSKTPPYNKNNFVNKVSTMKKALELISDGIL